MHCSAQVGFCAEGILCRHKLGADVEARGCLGQGFGPQKEIFFLCWCFILVAYIWSESAPGEVRAFCSQGLDSFQFSLCRQLLLLPQGPEIAFSRRQWKQGGCKTVCMCQSWSVEYSQQPPAGNEPKAVMQQRLRCSSTGKGKTPTSQDSDTAKRDWEVQQQPGCQHIPA